MSTARLIIGDVHDVLKTLPDNSVDLVLTSPPFLALRSYLPADHPQKDRELGSEPTPGAFIDALLDVVEECARVLAPHGSLCIELGDTYAGSGGAGGDYGENGLREGQPKYRPVKFAPDNPEKFGRGYGGREMGDGKVLMTGGHGWPQDKSLTLVPELFRISLAYGVNPLTGRTTEPWRIRNVIRWVRPNPPVGALGDKFRPATSELVVATMSRTRYFDLDAVREAHKPHHRQNNPNEVNRRDHGPGQQGGDARGLGFHNQGNLAGAPPLDWWAIPTEPYPGSHYATWPRDLLTKPIRSMCPERVCRVCGEPSRRIVEPSERWAGVVGKSTHDHTHDERGRNHPSTLTDPAQRTAEYVTKGWTDCGCSVTPQSYDVMGQGGSSCRQGVSSSASAGSTPPAPTSKWRNGVVLDPFAGSGTTLAVATGHGRDAIGIDIDSRNVALAEQRVGMFLEVEYARPESDGPSDPLLAVREQEGT